MARSSEIPNEGMFPAVPGADWVRDQSTLWVPTAHPLTISTVPNLGPQQLRPGIRVQRYLTATDVLGTQIPAAMLVRQWNQTIAADVLILVASILTDQEAHPADLGRIDAKWATELYGPRVQPTVQLQISAGARLLAPQLLFATAKFALVAAKPGPPVGSGEGAHALAMSILALGDSLGAHHQTPEMLGSWPVSLVLELTSNLHFNSWDQIPILIGRFQEMWRGIGSELANDRNMPSPEVQFANATGVQWIDAACFCIGVHSQVLSGGFVRFPREFCRFLGFDQSSSDHLLAALSRRQSDLAADIEAESANNGPDWSLNTLRRFPVVDLEDGTFVVLSLRLLYERVFGIPFFLEIQQALKANDQISLTAFEKLHADVIEQSAVRSAQSLAPSPTGLTRVYVEGQMQAVWRNRRGRTPSVCDFAIDYGHTWVCFEVIASRLSERAASGVDLDALLGDVGRIITRRKARQLASTISNLKRSECALTGSGSGGIRRFLPVLVTGYSFPVNPALMGFVRDVLRKYDLLQPPIRPLVIISLTELEYLEALADRGQSAGDLLLKWADSDMRDGPLDNFLAETGHGLWQPQRLELSKAALTDEIVERVAARVGAGIHRADRVEE